MSLALAGVLAYLVVQFAIGLWASRRIQNEEDYILAGRSLGVGLASFSIFATWFGAESIQGAAGALYRDGLSGASADPFGYGLCILLAGLVFAAPLWSRGFTTFGDLFRARYSPGVERLVILLIVPTSVIWSAAQIRAFGNVLAHTASMPLDVAIIAATLFVLVYTSLGGLLADAWTDLVQGIAVIVGLAALAGALLASGDLGRAWTALAQERLRFVTDAPWYETLEAWAVPVIGSVLAVELLSRILACRSVRVARQACLIGSGLYVLVGAVPALLGLIGPELVPDLAEPEQLIPALAASHLGPWLYVPFAGALISAILSTVDSSMLAGSTLVTHNVILRMRPALSEAARLRVSRLGVVVQGVIACVLALTSPGIKDLVELASAFGSAGVFVVACFGLFTTYGGARSAAASLVAGFAVWAAGRMLEWPAPYISALGASFAAYVAVAALGPSPASRYRATPEGAGGLTA